MVSLIKKCIQIFVRDGMFKVCRMLYRKIIHYKKQSNFIKITNFDDFPWEYTDRQRSKDAKVCILFTSHDASQTGAPLALLGLLTELHRRHEFECRVLLNSGGILEQEFARYAPILRLDKLISKGISRNLVLDTIALLFKEKYAHSFALCNTAVTPDINEIFARRGVSVISWIHELPTIIDMALGSKEKFRTIFNTSKRIICPAEYVKKSLIDYYKLEDVDRISVIYNGLSHQHYNTKSRDEIRRAIREQLGFTENAIIILGCGTVELRKGVDLFIQIAKQVLSSCHDEKTDVRFVWVGGPLDSNYIIWCRHDAKFLGIDEKIRFTGFIESPAPYFIAADIFALTSREDPFPFVNMEAMAAGLPVITFCGAGGAQELLGYGRGIVVPYLDIKRFSEELTNLVRDPEARIAISQRASVFMNTKKCTWSNFACELEVIMRSDLELPMLRSGTYGN